MLVVFYWKGWCVSDGKKIKSKYTEDWLPVRDIQNGMIILNNKERVTGVKIVLEISLYWIKKSR